MGFGALPAIVETQVFITTRRLVVHSCTLYIVVVAVIASRLLRMANNKTRKRRTRGSSSK